MHLKQCSSLHPLVSIFAISHLSISLFINRLFVFFLPSNFLSFTFCFIIPFFFLSFPLSYVAADASAVTLSVRLRTDQSCGVLQKERYYNLNDVSTSKDDDILAGILRIANTSDDESDISFPSFYTLPVERIVTMGPSVRPGFLVAIIGLQVSMIIFFFNSFFSVLFTWVLRGMNDRVGIS